MILDRRRNDRAARAVSAYELYQGGATLDEVGRQFGVTRERIRQIFREHGFPTRSVGESQQLKRQQQLSADPELICRTYLDCKDLAEVARRLELPRSLVREVVDSELTAADRRKDRNTRKKYSDDELIDFLRAASQDLGGVLSGAAYDEFARSRRTADGRPWPTRQTHILRYGTWRKAVTAAGLSANPSSPIAGQTLFDDNQCIDALRAAARSIGRAPTADEYEEFARLSGGAFPSQATVRNRLGRWYQALRRAGL